MPLHDQADALLTILRAVEEGADTLDVPERAPLALRLKQVRDLLEAVRRRGASEEARRKRGIGAPPIFARLT